MLDFYRFSHFQNNDTLVHAITTKSKQFSHDCSLALHTGEKRSNILSNRHAIAKEIGKNNFHFIVANQTHSDNIYIVSDKITRGWNTLESAIQNCDALVTNQSNIFLSILTADCVPILLFDPIQNVIAAIHAGWKGTQKEIASKTVSKMSQVFSCDPKNILAGIAPSIGKCCYEVGIDVAQHFLDTPQGLKSIGKKYMLDLPHINKQQLLNMGILEENIEMSQICTACEVARFFSYRKEAGCSGRFMSMIALKGIK